MSDATRQCTRAEERHRTVLQSLSCSKKMRAGKVSIKILFSSRMSKVRHELESRTRTSRTSRLDATSSRASPQMFTHPFHRKRVLVRRVRRTCHARHLQPTSENLYGRTTRLYKTAVEFAAQLVLEVFARSLLEFFFEQNFRPVEPIKFSVLLRSRSQDTSVRHNQPALTNQNEANRDHGRPPRHPSRGQLFG